MIRFKTRDLFSPTLCFEVQSKPWETSGSTDAAWLRKGCCNLDLQRAFPILTDPGEVGVSGHGMGIEMNK